ncbi:SMI1/KNR4 family protein [Parenemella sanctibonifatiensis]|uniref:SMI1/KNR4 family protein n=1 Tax=Parenemella sanctibonifatiensis TaxID=2016505 RepID=UPI001E378F51|nr:SMI1/KNR4 family protein [Parenemella sanctibonifatiensis]
MSSDPQADSALDALLSIGSEAISTTPIASVPDTALGRQLGDLLRRRNGFVAFESALVIRGAGSEPGMLDNWNDGTGWRAAYDDLADGLCFFAEDIFGGQFAFDGGTVVSFDPETGEREHLGSSLEEWAATILGDAEVLTGYPLAQEWQAEHGRLPFGQRLVPRLPFVAGGDFTVANLTATDDVQGMLERAKLALAFRDLPDGAQLTWPLD